MKKLFILACICLGSSVFAQAPQLKTIVISPQGDPADPANRPICVPVKEEGPGGCCIRWNVVCDNGYTWYGARICDFECQIQYAFEHSFTVYVGENTNPTSANPQNIKVKFDLRVLEGSSAEVIAQQPAMIEYTQLRLTEPVVTTTEAIKFVFQPGIYIIRNSEMSLNYFYR